jgi:hypothetical protein
MTQLFSAWQTSGGLVNGQLASFANILTGESAALQATISAGGTVDMNADFRSYNMPVITMAGLPTKVGEAANKPVVDATPGQAIITIDMFAEFHQITRQMEATNSGAEIVSKILDAATGRFPLAYDLEVLAPMASGAGITPAVEYNAAAPIASISSWLAASDNTAYMANTVVLTKAGARKLNFALDTQGRLQSNTGAAGLLGDMNVHVTQLTGTQLGVPSLMGIIGPFSAGHWASALGVTIERMPQATVAAKGPEQNIVNYRVEGAFGYGNGVDKINTGVGFTPLIDAV